MDCKAYMRLLEAYEEGTLEPDEIQKMRLHEQVCGHCAGMARLMEDCHRMGEETELPVEFGPAWRERIREEKGMNRKLTRSVKSWIAAAAALVFVVGGTLLTRDGISLPRENAREEQAAVMKRSVNADYSLGAANEYDTVASAEEAAGIQEEKIIRTAGFTVKTLDYQNDLERLVSLCEAMEGRVESLYSSGDPERGELCSSSLTLRVPAYRLDEFLTGAQGIGSMTSRHETVEDVSDQYYDVQSRLDTQLKKMERLQALLASAENIGDLIEIENSIADTQYQIDRYRGQIRSYDSRIDYSSVYVTLQEIRAEESDSVGFGEKIAAGLKNSVENGLKFLSDAAVFVISASPWLICLGTAGLLSIFLVRKRKERRKNGK